MEVPDFAPGCFGSVIAFSASDAICKNCPFAEKCKPAHEQRRQKLRAAYGIEAPSRKSRKQTVDAIMGESVMSLPPKTQTLLEKLDKSTLDVCGKLQRRVNPFARHGPKYLHLLCHLLLSVEGAISNDYLVASFMQKFNWKQDTAKAHVRIACQALEHVGAIRCVDGVVRLKQRK